MQSGLSIGCARGKVEPTGLPSRLDRRMPDANLWSLDLAGDPLLEAVGLGVAFVDQLDAVGLEHRHLADAGEVADVVRRVLPAGEIDEVARAGVDDGVRLAVEREGDEVAGADLDLLIADLRGAFAFDDVAPFLLHRMAVQHEGLLARRHAQHINVRALQPSGTAEAEELRLRIRVERMAEREAVLRLERARAHDRIGFVGHCGFSLIPRTKWSD